MRYVFYVFALTILAFLTMSLRLAPDQNLTFPDSSQKPMCWTDAIRAKIVRKYTKKYKMGVSGVTDGMPGGEVQELGVFFNIHRVISKQKARQIIVECVQDFIQEMNACEELRPYLRDYPVTVNNIYVALFIYHPDLSKVFYPDLRGVSTRNNKLIYKTVRPEQPYHYMEEEELFEDAVKLVEAETPTKELC